MTSEPQRIQQDQYNFPYHYLCDLEDGHLTTARYWSWGLNYMCAVEYLIERLRAERFDRLIDVGCGDGRLLRELGRAFPESELVGIDYSQEAIDLACALNRGLGFRCTDVREPQDMGEFDCATMIEVLEHIPLDQVDAFLSGVSALQPSGGRLLITVPHKNMPLQKKHFQHFTTQTLTDALNPHYKVESVFYLDRRTKKLRLFRGLMKNRLFILNFQPLIDFLYRTYRSRIFPATEVDCSRIGAICTRR